MNKECKECKEFAVVIPLTQGKVALIDLEDYPAVSQFKWYAFNNPAQCQWYARRSTQGGKVAVWMHRFIAHVGKGQPVDHENRDGLDNRRGNLRVANASLDAGNRVKPINGKNPFKGVRLVSKPSRRQVRLWSAAIKKDGQQHYLGAFITAEDAARAYDAKARELFGQFARLNFPLQGERQA